MQAVSQHLQKQVTLTGENEIKFPLIKIDYSNKIFKILTEYEINEFYENEDFPVQYSILKTPFLRIVLLLNVAFCEFLKVWIVLVMFVWVVVAT